jgi:hypothetical protein
MFSCLLAGLLCLACAETTELSAVRPGAAPTDSTFLFDSSLDTAMPADVSITDISLEDVRALDASDSDQLIDASILVDVSVDLGPSSGPYTTAQVDDIFQRGCGSCHNSTASPPLGGGVSSWINRGSGQSPLPLIVPGNHQRSYLYHKLADTHLSSPSNGRGTGMPMGRQLYSQSRLERIAGWIDAL